MQTHCLRWMTRSPRAARSAGLASSLAVCWSLAAAPTQADEQAPPVPIMREPGHVVDVMDSFDDENGDPFDIAVSLGFEYLSKRARILRESAVFSPGLTTGGFTSRNTNVGRYIEQTSKLVPQLELGLYKDLALYTRIPVVL